MLYTIYNNTIINERCRVGCVIYTVKNGVLRYTFAMVFWDTFIYIGVT